MIGTVQLSVVIPAKNEERLLARCLLALQREREAFGHVGEIIVVDNGSTDQTIAIAAEHSVLACCSDGTIAHVRNTGARCTQGGILCFIDADVEVVAGWSQAIVDHVAAVGERVRGQVFGCLVGIDETGPWIEQAWHDFMSGNRNVTYINSGNLIIHRDLFLQLGGFNERLITGEDVDLCQRARALGATVVTIPGIKTIHHGNPKTLFRFFTREFWHGLNAIDNIRSGKAKKIDLLAVAFLPLLAILVWVSLQGSPMAASVLVGGVLLAMVVLGSVRTGKLWSLRSLQVGALLTVFVVARACAVPGALVRGRVRLGGGGKGSTRAGR